MLEWIFKSDTGLDKILRLGFGGFILGVLVKNVIVQITPSGAGNTLICLAVSLLLVLPVLTNTPPKDPTLKGPTIALASAYVWISLLYFFHWTHLVDLPKGYDAVTDLIGTFCFVVAWGMVSGRETDKQSKGAERVALAVLCLFAFVSGASKLLIDLHVHGGMPADGQAARLILNVCNGAIFLSLYGQMRRLLPSPDLISHTVILLFGCAQIAAHGRDCLESKACASPSLEGIVALMIAWTLLLGKIAFGAYISYLYFNGQVEERGSVLKAEDIPSGTSGAPTK